MCSSLPALFNGWGYTGSLCCLFGRVHGQRLRALAVSTAMCFLWTLRSRLAFFHNEGAHARVPQGSSPAVTEAQRRLQSWGSQIDLSAELETDTAFSLPSPDRFSASSQGWEAHAVVSSAPIETQTLQLSDSEELDVSVNARYRLLRIRHLSLVLMRSLLRL